MSKAKNWKVYIVTSMKNDKYYIGVTSKEGKELDRYFGSGKESPTWDDKEKTIIFQSTRKSEAKFVELFLQMCYRTDEHCINDMLNIRTRMKWVERLTDDDIFEIREKASRVLEVWEQRRGGDVRGWKDSLLQLQLDLWEPTGEPN